MIAKSIQDRIALLTVYCKCYNCIVNKRKMVAASVSEAKRSKVDSEEQDESAQKEAQNVKKTVEYRANIAICETQMEELRYVLQ